jgi:hypothetical protein
MCHFKQDFQEKQRKLLYFKFIFDRVKKTDCLKGIFEIIDSHGNIYYAMTDKHEIN